jgi:HEAT repeat protein
MDALSAIPTDALLERTAEVAQRDPSRESDDRWSLVRELHRRGERSVFQAAAGWCVSSEPLLRCLGADTLGQLGFEAQHPFAAESAPILTSLLGDLDVAVVSCALVALGHLCVGDPEALCPLASHQAADVRGAVAFCLGTRDDVLSRNTLIALSGDADTDIRSWATFGLGSLSDVDTPVIRDALVARLSDPDHEVRGEAMLGLAVRGDARAVPAILEELKREEVSVLAIEAAGELPHETFLARLEALLEARPDDSDIKAAVERCRAK